MAEIKPRVDSLVAANTEFANSSTSPATMSQLQVNESERVFVVTCMDPRVVPEQFLGPNAFPPVFRNAFGRVTPDVVRSITIFRSLATSAKDLTVIVVHHTDCGATHLDAEKIKADIIGRNPADADVADTLNFRLFTTEQLDQAVLNDMAALRAESLLSGVRVRGFVLSLETGLLRELEA